MPATLGINDRVRFLGWRRDLATIYGATDVFMLTSRNEGTPVALIEAMASGVPGVSTDVGGVKDVIETPDVGARVPDGDVAGLAAHIVRYLADPDLRRRPASARRARPCSIATASIVSSATSPRSIASCSRRVSTIIPAGCRRAAP